MADLLVERPRDGVALVRINRPEARNALNGRVRMLLADAFTELGRDDGVRAIVLTGDKDAFAAGADIREMADAGAVEIMLRQTHLLWAAIASCPKPVIAAVNGFALGGGCELAHARGHHSSPARAPGSASRRSASASCRGPAAPSG